MATILDAILVLNSYLFKKKVITVKPVSQVAITHFYITNIACVWGGGGGKGGVSLDKVIVNI